MEEYLEWPSSSSNFPDYETLKIMAKEQRQTVKKLLALSSNNDPFYCGMPAQVDKAKWFAELWQRFGYTSGVHLRRMHYQIVSQEPPVKMVNGLPYINTEKCWDELGKASQAARYLDMVDPENFADHRNGAPVDNIDYSTELMSELYITNKYAFDTDIATFDFPGLPASPRYAYLNSAPQRYHLEMWCEKSTQDDILRPLASRYKTALQYGLGELSVTLAIEALRRFEKSNKPVRIFYISDFDVAGWNMPQSMARKLQYFNLKLGLNLDIKLFPTILTFEQVKTYNLPGTPMKDGVKGKTKFKERFGVDATELDALEALHPGVMEEILEEELSRYYDNALPFRVTSFWSRIQRQVTSVAEQVYTEFGTSIDDARGVWLALQDEFKQRIDVQIERNRRVWQAVYARLEEETPDISDEELPEAAYADEREGALFDSSWGYLEQNDVYQAHKINGSEEEE